jgi:hypothetical protein
VATARAFGDAQPPGRFPELRYERLVAEPEAVVRELLAFLGEAWDPAVLRFDQAEHDATERYRTFTAERRRTGGDPSPIYRSRVGTGGRALDPLLRGVLRATSGALLGELGYLGDR